MFTRALGSSLAVERRQDLMPTGENMGLGGCSAVVLSMSVKSKCWILMPKEGVSHLSISVNLAPLQFSKAPGCLHPTEINKRWASGNNI